MLEPIAFSLDFPHARLAGVLRNVSAGGLFSCRPANVTANDRVAAWVRHLVLNALAPDGVAKATCCAGQDAILRFAAVKDARAALEELLRLYFAGLARPLHFFPKTACIYSEYGELNRKVRSTWEGSDFGPRGECEDPYYQLAFRGTDPLDAEFEANAQIVFGRMTDALDTVSLA
jgi:exodeoxyribonuclease V gamma subunit